MRGNILPSPKPMALKPTPYTLLGRYESPRSKCPLAAIYCRFWG